MAFVTRARALLDFDQPIGAKGPVSALPAMRRETPTIRCNITSSTIGSGARFPNTRSDVGTKALGGAHKSSTVLWRGHQMQQFA
jgi:hypothetical protein